MLKNSENKNTTEKVNMIPEDRKDKNMRNSFPKLQIKVPNLKSSHWGKGHLLLPFKKFTLCKAQQIFKIESMFIFWTSITNRIIR